MFDRNSPIINEKIWSKFPFPCEITAAQGIINCWYHINVNSLT